MNEYKFSYNVSIKTNEELTDEQKSKVESAIKQFIKFELGRSGVYDEAIDTLTETLGFEVSELNL